MSSEKVFWIGAVIAFFIYGLGLGYWSEKHWQDEWYSAHGCVVNLAPGTYDLKSIGLPSSCVLKGAGADESFVTTPLAAWPPFCPLNYHLSYNPQTPDYPFKCEAPPPPKPTKGSKRHAIQMDPDGGRFGGMDAPNYHEKEPAPKPSIEEGRLWFEAPSHELHYYKNGIDMTCSSWNESSPAAQPAEPNQQ